MAKRKKSSMKSRNKQIQSIDKRILIFIGILLFIGVIIIGLRNHSQNIQQGMPTTNLSSSPTDNSNVTTSNVAEELNELFTYTIPPGWVEKSTKYRIELESPDIHYLSDDSPYFDKGAKIFFSREVKPTSYSNLKSEIDSIQKNQDQDLYDYPSRIIAGENALNYFNCYEGCYDGYKFENDGYIYSISLRCADCDSKEETDNSFYASARDQFINSIRYKNNF